MRTKLAYVSAVLFLGCGGPIESTPDAADVPCPFETPDAGTHGCEMRRFYHDKDGDGFGNWVDTEEFMCVEDGIRLGLSLNNHDCADFDVDANPLASSFRRDAVNGFSVSAPYDWNCDAREEPRFDGGLCLDVGCR